MYTYFSHPYFLLLLLLLPGVWYIVWSRREHFTNAQIYTIFGLRSLVVVLLILALAGMFIPLDVPRGIPLIFVTDTSHSISPVELGWMKGYIKRALSAMESEDRAAWINFSRQANVNLNFASKSEVEEAIHQATLDSTGGEFTNIEAGLRTALAIVPTKEIFSRMVLLSDGNENVGQAEKAAKSARDLGIKIYPILPPEKQIEDLFLENIYLPNEVHVGEAFRVKVVLGRLGEKNPCKAHLVLRRQYYGAKGSSSKSKIIDEVDIELAPGRDVYLKDEVLKKSGCYLYIAEVSSSCDTNSKNNQLLGVITAVGKPQVLCIDGLKGKSSKLVKALKLKGVKLTVGNIDKLPHDLYNLANYDALIFNNVDKDKVTPKQMTMIQNYVAELGGGFAMLGGENSFSGGGYAKTPIEQVLPVYMGDNFYYKFKQVLVVLVIDRSSSMKGRKIEMAREAAKRIAKQLRDSDMMALIVFDSKYDTKVNLTMMWDKQDAIIKQIDSVRSSKGGTNIYPALEKAYRMLSGVKNVMSNFPMQVKHIILLTDGKSYGGKFKELAKKIAKARMSVSAIAVGSAADTDLLITISKTGKGLFHHPKDMSKLPEVFVQDLEDAISRSTFVEKPFIPEVMGESLALAGLTDETFPPLKGYMVAKPKPEAETPLISRVRNVEDPILAVWRYGLGRSLAYTSDVEPRWATAWISWKNWSRFWSQLVRYIMMRKQKAISSVRLRRIPNGALVEVEPAVTGAPLGDLQAILLGPGGKRYQTKLEKTSSNLYQGSFITEDYGLYLANIRGELNRKVKSYKNIAVALSPILEEHRRLRPDRTLLQKIAEISQGEFNPERMDAFLTPPPETTQPYELWHILLIMALIGFVVDVALRRLWL